MSLVDKINVNKGIFYAVITAVMWGFLAIALKIAIQYCDSLTIVWSRFAIALTVLMMMNRVFSKRAVHISQLPVLGIVAGLLLAANYYSFMMGLELTTVSNTQVLMQLGPLFLVIISVIVFKERIAVIQCVGFLIACFGFFLFYQEQLFFFFNTYSSYRVGNFWIICAAITWAGFAAIQKKLSKHYSLEQINMLIYAVPVVCFFSFVNFKQFIALGALQWLLLFYLGVNTVIAYGCLGLALKHVEANKVSMIIALNPLLTILLLVLLETIDISWFKGESLSFLGYVGVLFILVGVLIVVGFKSNRTPTG